LMWFYILPIILVALLAWWLTRTNLFRHWSRHAAEPRGHPIGSAGGRAADDVARRGQNPSGLRKRPPGRSS